MEALVSQAAAAAAAVNLLATARAKRLPAGSWARSAGGSKAVMGTARLASIDSVARDAASLISDDRRSMQWAPPASASKPLAGSPVS